MAFIEVVLDQTVVWTGHMKAGSVLRVWIMHKTNVDCKRGYWVRIIQMKVTWDGELAPEKYITRGLGREHLFTNPDFAVRLWVKKWGCKQQHPWCGSMIIVLSVISIFSVSINGSVVVLFKAFDDRLQDTAWGYKTNNSSLLHGCYLTCKNEYLCASAG